MKYLQNSDPRFRNLGYKVSIFFAVVISLLVVMAFLMGWRRDFFQPMDYFECRPARAEKLTPGMDITLHGIRIGGVVSVDLDERGKPKMVFRIRRDAVRWLHADASLLLEGLEPLGDPHLAIAPGSDDAGELLAGSVLPFERNLTIGETVAKLNDEIMPVVHEASRFVKELSQPEGEVQKSVTNIRLISESLTRELPELLADARSSARLVREELENVRKEGGDIAQTRAHLLGITSSLDKSLPGMIQSAQGSLASLGRTSAQIEAATKVSASELQELVRTSQLTTEKADGLIEDFRKIWILKLLMPVKEKKR